MRKSNDILHNAIHKSASGVFVELEGHDQYLDEKSKYLDIMRSVKEILGGYELQLTVRNKSDKKIKVYSIVVCDFLLPKNLKIKEVLEHGWLSCSTSRFRKPIEETKRKRIFLTWFQNANSFDKKYGYLTDSIISEWFTILREESSSFVIGAISTADQFSQVYIKKCKDSVRIRVTCQVDGLVLKPRDITESEKIVLLGGGESEINECYSRLIANTMGVKDLKPPIKAMCCSYYWRGDFVSQDIVNQELKAIGTVSPKVDLDYIQIDSGFSKYCGDWMDYYERFPCGLIETVRRIKSLGYKAGIWLAPVAADPRSKLSKNHREWLMRDVDGKFIEAISAPILNRLIPMAGNWVCDPTNDNYLNYLKKVLRHFVEVGFDFFKIDYLSLACLSANYSRPMTRAQALRNVVGLIREIVGNKLYILGAIAPISPLVGLVDSARMGIDIIYPYVNCLPLVRSLVNNSLFMENLRSNKIRKFLNRVVWNNDPDCLVFSSGTGIRSDLIERHKRFVAENKMSVWIGDNFARLKNSEKRSLINFFSYLKTSHD